MRQFAGYPIVINYNLHMQLRYSGLHGEEHRLREAGQYEAERQLSIKVATTSDSILENNMYKEEIDRYEGTVYGFLQVIADNPVGRMVLENINKETTVWIIPKGDAAMKCSGCYNAQTGPLKYDIQRNGNINRGAGFGDTVIWFNTKLGIDTLIHELVHAYRYSRNKWDPMAMKHDYEPRASLNREEFFAHQIETIYLSQENQPLGKYYGSGANATKEEVYDFLVTQFEMLTTLKYFLRHEYLAMLAASGLVAPYNPFRDIEMLLDKCAQTQACKSDPRRSRSFTPSKGGPRRETRSIGR